MNPVDPLNQSLYFSAAAAAAQQTAAETRKKEKAQGGGRVSFNAVLKKSAEKSELVSEGFPPEIAGLSVEEATIFLKDAVDMAGDELAEKASAEAFASYRTAVSQFMRYVVKNSFEIHKFKRPGYNKKGKPRDPAIQIETINRKLESLASDLLYNHADKLRLLARVDEINGLLVDLLAA
jgi:uncharacterized protein YaaR (DUF327 family)